MNNKRNVVFLFADDQRFDTISALGNTEVKTPNIDKLVKNGTSFTHAMIPGGTCGAVCMPSRAMVNTGKSLFNLHNHGVSIPDDHKLIGELFKEQGYETCGIGKWHNGPKSYARSFTTGGEIFFGGMWDHWNIPANEFDPTGKYENVVPFSSDFYHSRVLDNMVADHIHLGKHSTEVFGEKAIDFIKNRKQDKPFYLYTAFMAPHDPRTMPKHFKDMYDPKKITLPKNYMRMPKFEFGIHDVRDEILEDYPREEDKIREHIAEYYGMISHLDYEIGLIIQSLKDTNQFDNTVFVFAGDNGLALGQHGLMGKQNAYEHSIRVPLIFCGNGINKGVKIDKPCYLMDIFATLCDIMGAKYPSDIDSISLNPFLDGHTTKVRDAYYFAYADLLRAVEKDGYKLIVYASDLGKHFQLFNEIKDPFELNDLSKKTEYREIFDSLKKELIIQKNLWNDNDNIPVSKAFWKSYNS